MPQSKLREKKFSKKKVSKDSLQSQKVLGDK